MNLKIDTRELSEHNELFQETMSGSIDFLQLDWKIGRNGIVDQSPIKKQGKLLEEIRSKDLKVLKEVGQGATSTVCTCEYMGKRYALKIISVEDQKNSYKNSRTEIECLRGIDCKYIVSMHQGLIRNQRICILLDYMSCGSLERALTMAKKRFPIETLSSIAYMLLRALEYIHSKNVIHRDIKPGNVLLEHKGYVKLTDFGLATTLNEGELCTEVVGSFRYMAPEVMNYEPYDFSADIWSFGMTMAELFYGKFPLPIANEHQFKDLISSYNLWKKSDFVHVPDLYDLISRCTFYNPDDRPTASELLQHPFIQRTEQLFRKQILGKYMMTNHLNTAKNHKPIDGHLSELVETLLKSDSTQVVQRKRSNALFARKVSEHF